MSALSSCKSGDAPAQTLVTAPAPVLITDRRQQRFALIALLTGGFLSPLDYFIVNLALPAIQTGLNASAAQLQLVISAYASSFAVFLITAGRLGDLFGRKRMFMIGMGGFVLASAICAAAPNGMVLIAGRALQGLAAAIISPQVLATIRTVFPADRQTKVMGFYGFMFGIASVAGQLVGGALITLHPFGLGWQAIFLINLPIGLLALYGAWKFVPESRAPRSAGIDLPGVLLISAVLALLIYPLAHGREAHWPLWSFAMLAASVPVLWVFIIVEGRIARRGGDPLVDLQLFRNPAFAIALALTFAFYCESVFFLTYGIYLQDGLRWTPMASGLAIMPFALGALLSPLGSHGLTQRFGNRVLALGYACMATGFAVLTVALSLNETPHLLFYAGLVCGGIGHGIVLPSVVRIALSETPQHKAGLASGIVTSVLQIGGAFGATAISGGFFSVLANRHTGAAYAEAFQSGSLILALLFAVCVAGSLWLVRLQQRRVKLV